MLEIECRSCCDSDYERYEMRNSTVLGKVSCCSPVVTIVMYAIFLLNITFNSYTQNNFAALLNMNIISSIRSKSIKLETKHKDILFPPRSRSDTAEYGSLIWKFDPDNHYLHPKLTRLVYSKCVLRFMGGTFAILFLMMLAKVPGTVIAWYFIIREVLFDIPFLTMIILSFNRDAWKFIWKSSEFWMKIIYAVISPILYMIRYHHVLRDLSENEVDPPYLGYLLRALNMVATPMGMIIFGGVDAIPQMSHKWKVILGSLVAVNWSWQSLNLQLLTPESEDFVIHIEMTGSRVSFLSLESSVSGMLAMFLWKELIDIVRNPKRCIAINYKPYLEWERKKQESEFMRSASLPSVS